jgi:SHS2 domain-containing protein
MTATKTKNAQGRLNIVEARKVIRIHETAHDAQHPYAKISNALIFDPDISAETFRTIVRLLSKPKDWRIIRNAVGKEFGLTGHELRTVFPEAEKAGYLHRCRVRKADGTLGGFQYELFENPKETPINRALPPRVEKRHMVRSCEAAPLLQFDGRENPVNWASAPCVEITTCGETDTIQTTERKKESKKVRK